MTVDVYFYDQRCNTHIKANYNNLIKCLYQEGLFKEKQNCFQANKRHFYFLFKVGCVTTLLIF